MGTNYFAVRNRPSVEEPIHIGKSSFGWKFLFQSQNDTWRDIPVVWNSYNDVKNWLKKYTVDSDTYVIMDEYDKIISFDDFFAFIDWKQREEDNPDDFKYSENIEGYRFEKECFL